jgi:shikimate 5-dehydrogenase
MSASRVLFVGVATGGSAIHRVFPAWMAELGLEARIEGVDLATRAPDVTYRELLARIDEQDDVLGAVITSHKLGIHAAARDLMEPADLYVDLLREVNAISKRGGILTAHARDPLAVERVLPWLLAGREPEEALCLGAGGAGVAVVISLLYAARGERLIPRQFALRRVLVTDIRADRLAALRRLVDVLPAVPSEVGLVHVGDASDNDDQLATLAPGSLVVNATGLGKDAPGSPIGADALFPTDAIVWDANYRGELLFLRQARAQAAHAGLRVHDGWSYFLHGWIQALAPILTLPLDAGVIARLAAAANRHR